MSPICGERRAPEMGRQMSVDVEDSRPRFPWRSKRPVRDDIDGD